MISCALQTIVVADHSKLGRHTLSTIIPLTEADVLFTGKEAAEEVAAQLRQQIKVLIVQVYALGNVLFAPQLTEEVIFGCITLRRAGRAR